MWKLGLTSCNSFSENICFKFLISCLCSVADVGKTARVLSVSLIQKFDKWFCRKPSNLSDKVALYWWLSAYLQSQHNAKKIRFTRFPEKKLHGLSLNFHIYVSRSDIYICPRMVHLISCSRIGRPIEEIYKSLTETWIHIGFRNEAAQFYFWEYIRFYFSG